MEIILPQMIGYGRLDTLIRVLHEIRDHENGKRKALRLNWRRVEKIAPAGYAILACIHDSAIEHACPLENVFVKKRFRKIPEIQKLFEIETHTQLPPASIHNQELPQSILSGQGAALNTAFPDHLEKKFKNFLSEDAAFACRLTLNELMQNSLDHSSAERYYLYAGLWEHTHKKREIHFGALDMGVTLPAKLEQKYSSPSDEAYLDLALKEGITTRRSRPGGLGLFHTFEYLKDFSGTLTLISRRAQLIRYFKSKRVVRQSLKHILHGTWAMARIPMDTHDEHDKQDER